MKVGKIKDRLKKMDNKNQANTSQESQNKEKENKSCLIRNKLAGNIIENDGGEFYIREINYNLDREHGPYKLGKLLNYQIEDFLTILNNSTNKPFSKDLIKKSLFIDTETTGLMGGTGTLAFMIGVGFFSNNEFIVRQYFMRDYDDEYALLLDLKKLFKDYDYLFSFNGKSFDLPLLQTRFVMNRLKKIGIANHFDLLHMARRVWNHLPSCSLASLEEEILKIYRRDDIPGSDIPKIYFKFLRKKDPLLVAPIFKHNLIDIVSLVTLLIHLLEVYNNTTDYKLTSSELYNLACQWEKRKELKKSINFFEKAREGTDSYKLKEKINFKLSWQYKRNDDWSKAISIWKEMIEQNQAKLFPYVELAKYYEHKKKDFIKAKKYVDKAKVLLREKRIIFKNYKEKKEKLNYRINRLEKKIIKKGD